VKRKAGVLAAALAALLTLVAAATGGAPNIASAPELPLGQWVKNTRAGIDFWRVKLNTGDRLTLDYAPQQSAHFVEICVFTPSVSDADVAKTPCYATHAGYAAGSFSIDARTGGTWTVAVLGSGACESSRILDLSCAYDVSYSLSAGAKHGTRLALRAPNLVRRNSTFYATGTLTGAPGPVLVEQSWNAARWQTLGLQRTSAKGAFRIRLHPTRTGKLQLRASFPEGTEYVGSSAVARTRVA
jgi:hypothetical protein